MDVIHYNFFKKIKYCLVFFCFLLALNCDSNQNISNFKVNYDNDKAVNVSFVSNKSENFSIHLKNNSTAILGSFSNNGNILTFNPIIPFTSGETYIIRKDENVVLSFIIKPKSKPEHVELLNIYPTTNVVPENLLKMYFEFSKPMQEVGNTLDFIQVFDNTTNKKVDVFLALETELWNKDHTILTLWLDPGRIKKDLIPNKEKGTPIINGHEYQLTLSKAFREANGDILGKDYLKTFAVTDADKTKPSMDDWIVSNLISSDGHSIKIEFNEPLDAVLLKETVKIYDASNNFINMEMIPNNNQVSIEFKNKKRLKKGKYKMQVESRLEDLAGNNLNRLFDEDLQSKKEKDTSLIKEIHFIIE